MPVNKHLNWFDIADFTPGLYDELSEAYRLVMPNNAAAILEGAYAQPHGGLRAFWKPTTVSVSGIVSISTEKTLGLWVRGGVSLRDGSASDSFDALLVTMDTVDFKVRIYRMDGSNGETTWKVEHTTAASASAGARQAEFGIFKTTAGLTYYLVVIRTTSASVSGLYTVAYVGGAGPPAGDGVVVRQQAYNGSLAVNQARILIGEGNSSKMYYSDIGDITFTGPSYLDVEPNQGAANITSITPFAPDDLLVSKEGAPWVQTVSYTHLTLPTILLV